MIRPVADHMRDRAKNMRSAQTVAEVAFWELVRAKRLSGLKFRRQAPIGGYIVDFFCPARKLIVELDGDQHNEPAAVSYDQTRTDWLVQQGYRVQRFDNDEVLQNPSGVALVVAQLCEK